MKVILGNGISSYIIASCLDYLNDDFIILSKNKRLKMPSIMHLQYNDDKELLFFQKLFKIKNINKYIKHVKVGYKFLDKIYDTYNKTMLDNYLAKQHRNNEKTSMNEKINNYDALDLTKICKLLVKRYKNKVTTKSNISDNKFKYCYIYDTIGENIDKEAYKFYLVKEHNNIKKYDYIYDCDLNDIKRYTKTTTEYIEPPKHKKYITLLNYYKPFKVIEMRYCCIIGRYATGTQTKQKDIIKYILGDKYGI